MSQEVAPLKRLPSAAEESAALIEQVRLAGQQSGLDPEFGRSALQALEVIASGLEEDYTPLKTAVQRYIRLADQWKASLQDFLNEVESLESRRARQDRFSERWWQQRLAELQLAFQDDRQAGVEQWLQTYAETLLAWEFELVESLVAEEFDFPEDFSLVLRLIKRGTQALLAGRYTRALGMVDFLTRATRYDGSGFVLDEPTRSGLFILSGRIYLYHAAQGRLAYEQFTLASQSAPQDGLPDAALGEYYRRHGQSDLALQSFHLAIEKSPTLPDGYLGIGLYHEDQGLWDQAADSFEKAVEQILQDRDPLTSLSRMLVPESGKAYLVLAHRIKKANPQSALQAVDKALELGINGEGNYPELDGYRLKGDLLKQLGQNQESAQAYHETGLRFHWRAEYRAAAPLFDLARQLDPKFSAAYWYLSDALQVLSFDERLDYPHVNLERLNESLQVWQEGMRLGLPDATYSWAYIVRAFINEQLSRVLGSDYKARSWQLTWEALAYVERAILLNPDEGYRWSYLSRYYRYLALDRNALYAIDKALEFEPEQTPILEERAAVLANVGEVEEALEAIEAVLAQEENSWRLALRAHIVMGLKQYRPALENISRAIQESPADLGYREIKAFNHLMLGENELAAGEFQWIFDRGSQEEYQQNQISFGWAAFYLGLIKDHSLFEQAEKAFAGLLDDPVSSGSAHRGLGLSYLAQGKLAQDLLEDSIFRGIKLATNRRELEELIDMDLALIRKHLPVGKKLESILAQIENAALERTKAIESLHTPESELLAASAEVEKRGEVGSWAWVGARAGLGRLYLGESGWEEAASHYRSLAQEKQRFPEAHIGLLQGIDGLQALGDESYQYYYETQEALEAYQKALAWAIEVGDKERQAGLHTRIALVNFEAGDPEATRKALAQALNLDQGELAPGRLVGTVARSLVLDPGQYWSLRDELEQMAEEVEPGIRPRLENARSVLAVYLDEYFHLGMPPSYDESLPYLSPITVELSNTLIPEDTGDNWPLINDYLPAMRDRIQADLGFKIPWVSLRGNDYDMPPDSYLIMLAEIPEVIGYAYSDRLYCLASTKSVQTLEIDTSALIGASHPLTGEPGTWIPQEYRQQLERSGLTYLNQSLEFMVLHLEAVLRRNLAAFMDLQAAEDLLSAWGEDDRLAELILESLPDWKKRVRFTRVLRTLLAERVPLTRPETILDALAVAPLEDEDVSPAVSAIRLRVRDLLPGNQPGALRVEFPTDLEADLLPWIWADGNKKFFAAVPEDLQIWLEKLRKLLSPYDQQVTLVVQSSELRSAISSFISQEFPGVTMLSAAELAGGGG